MRQQQERVDEAMTVLDLGAGECRRRPHIVVVATGLAFVGIAGRGRDASF